MLVDLPPVVHSDSESDDIPKERCDCGAHHEWVWWTPDPDEPAHAVAQPRWFVPPVNPCRDCKHVHEKRAADDSLSARQARAGVPPRARAYRLTRGRVRYQQAGEDIGTFAHDVIGQRDVIGVTLADVKQVRTAGSWRPGRGSMYIEGPCGSGKSLLVAALVSSLLSIEEMERIEHDDAELAEIHGWDYIDKVRESGRDFHLRRAPVRTPVLTTETELIRRVKLSWSGDKDPLKQLADAQVLVLDDFGIEGTKDIVVSAIERLICYRYDHELPMVLTSNLSWREIVHAKSPRYGARVASRLHQMVTERHVLGGIDWRSPPDPIHPEDRP
jgi:DNA replication protein DnaC